MKLLNTIPQGRGSFEQKRHNFSTSSILSFQSHDILSFDNLNSSSPNGSLNKDKNLGRKGKKRSPAHAQNHILAERIRREKLSLSFIALAALLPALKKTDKAAVLTDAIKYVKELKERVALLESKKTKAEESVVVLNKPELCGARGGDDCLSRDKSVDAGVGGSGESLLQVKARVLGKEVLLRIHCQNQKGILVKILTEIQGLNLVVMSSSVLPFGDSILALTIIAQLQMGEGYNLKLKELVKNLRLAILKFMS